jgi:fibronectin type 3 domain-containing protein
VITGYPTNPSTTTSATFTCTDTESGVTFLCQRDLGGYQACTSPVNYTSLAQGSHRFDLKARDQAGNESVVASYSWTIDTRPAAPTGLTAAAGNASVKLTWQTAARATSYKVKRATVSGGPYTVVATGITALTWTNTGLANGTTYYYVVSAVNTAGEGANSVPASATPLAPPAAPTNLAVAVVSSTQLNLSWTDNSTNETGFRIERSLNGSSFSEIATVGANVRTYSSTGLTPNTVYYYRVRAYNAAGNSAYTGVKSARTKA